MFLQWLQARLGEATSQLGIAAFLASTGTALDGTGFPRAGLILGAFITKGDPISHALGSRILG